MGRSIAKQSGTPLYIIIVTLKSLRIIDTRMFTKYSGQTKIKNIFPNAKDLREHYV